MILFAMELLESRKEIDAEFRKFKEADLRDDSNRALEAMVKEAQDFLRKVNPQSKLLSAITVTDAGMKWNFRAFRDFTRDYSDEERNAVVSEVTLMYIEALYREAAFPKYPYLN